MPIPTHHRMWGGSEEKIMFNTSTIFHVIISITWIVTIRSKNVQKKRKVGWKIRT